MNIVRVAWAMVAIPPLLTALLVGLMKASDGAPSSISNESFELGLAPIAVAVFVVTLTIFRSLMYLGRKLRAPSPWMSSVVWFVALALPVVLYDFSLLSDSRLRWGYRVDHLMQACPWLLLGATGGLLFRFIALRPGPARSAPSVRG